MITYILNIIACSGLLLLVYRIFLSYEKSYTFNRFYLLFSLFFSLIVPLTAIHVPYKKGYWFNQQIIAQMLTKTGPFHPKKAVPVSIASNNQAQQATIRIKKYNEVPRILGVLYVTVTLVMLFRLVSNCYHILR
jgi:hypothetical protein